MIEYPTIKEYGHRLEDDELYLTVHSLEELIEISKKIHQNFIVDLDSIEKGEMELVIYDNYIE